MWSLELHLLVFRGGYPSASKGAAIRTPSLTKKRSQLPSAEVPESRKLSSVHIRVERVTQRLQVFRVFHTELSVSFVERVGHEGYTTIDKLVGCCVQWPCQSADSNYESEWQFYAWLNGTVCGAREESHSEICNWCSLAIFAGTV